MTRRWKFSKQNIVIILSLNGEATKYNDLIKSYLGQIDDILIAIILDADYYVMGILEILNWIYENEDSNDFLIIIFSADLTPGGQCRSKWINWIMWTFSNKHESFRG